LKVTVTAGGNLSADLKFWHYGDKKLIYTTEIVSPGPTLGDFGLILDDLGARGVKRLMQSAA
jgi:5-amino-6-(5-phosphoribosylamino)uracil reductase